MNFDTYKVSGTYTSASSAEADPMRESRLSVQKVQLVWDGERKPDENDAKVILSRHLAEIGDLGNWKEWRFLPGFNGPWYVRAHDRKWVADANKDPNFGAK